MSKVTMIKKDAKISVTIGTGFLECLQQALLNVSSNRTPEEVAEFNRLASENKYDELSGWMRDVVTLTCLINDIEREALATGQTYEELTPEDNSPQSQAL